MRLAALLIIAASTTFLGYQVTAAEQADAPLIPTVTPMETQFIPPDANAFQGPPINPVESPQTDVILRGHLPGEISNLTAEPGYNEVTLKWDKPSVNADKVRWYRITNNVVGNDYYWVNNVYSTSYTVTGLSGGIPYNFEVRAAAGVDKYSRAQKVTVTPYGAPYVQNLTGKVLDENTVSLSWEPNIDITCRIAANVGYPQLEFTSMVCYDKGEQPWLDIPVTGYIVSNRAGNVNPFAEAVEIESPTITTVDIGGLTKGMPYQFVVMGSNEFGSEHNSNIVTLTPWSTPENAPTNLRGTAHSSTFELSWNAPVLPEGSPPITQYVIEAKIRQSTSNAELVREFAVSGDVTTHTIPRLTHADYAITVSAVNHVGAGPASNEFTYQRSTGPE